MRIEIAGLEELAAKLGVTVEYLWGVLLKQAPISGTLYLLSAFSIVAFWCAVVSLRSRISDLDEDQQFVVYVILFMLFILSLGIVPTSISQAVSGYLNPEYWAMNNILNHLGK